jgi:S-adenosylmethionine decarboxylase
LANPYILVSSLVLGALALPSSTEAKLSWIKRLFGVRDRSPMKVSAPPKIENEAGWTLIPAADPEAFSEWLGRDEEGLPFRPDEIPSLGSHLLIEMYGCDGKMLEAEEFVAKAMRDAADSSKATVVEQSFHEFKPYGVSGAVIIQESHYTIHTWPEHRYAAVDLFYCGGTVLVHKAVDVLRDRFKPERIKFLVVRRGLQHDVDR